MTDFDIYTISDEYINTRLDKWVKKYYQGLKHNEIEIALRKNKIKVNKKKVKSNYRFQDFDQIEISIKLLLIPTSVPVIFPFGIISPVLKIISMGLLILLS